ncbi:BON domain-containing protein [Rhodopila sp.]|uniref:BON domain-containing protein n=1 Tax=Rhodopila sp. TaxID=2480087 RepID=UPI003D0BBE99
MSQDNHLQQAVLAELGWEPSVTAAHIGVTANAGVVTLTGQVESFSEKHVAVVAAGRVRGVKAVAEEFEVRLPFDRKRGDDDIAAAAVERLVWNTSIPRDSVAVKVEKGWLTLTGKTDWYFQKDAAGQDVRHLLGAIGLSNQIMVRPKVNTSNLSDDITHALHRSWFFDENNVRVSAEGGHVHLTGTVHSPHNRQTAAGTAWAAPGVTAVENDIAIA